MKYFKQNEKNKNSIKLSKESKEKEESKHEEEEIFEKSSLNSKFVRKFSFHLNSR